MEIGSEFYIGKTEWDIIKHSDGLPQWLSKYGNITLTSSGRGAISLILSQIKPKIKKVLLPVYICDSVIKPFISAGYDCIFYNLNSDFTVELDCLIHSDLGVFLHMGYFGFHTNKNMDSTLQVLKEKSVIIIEDVTHTLFSNYPRYASNDFCFGSIRKWFGIPSGGFLASHKIVNFELLDASNNFVNLRETGLHRKSDYMKSRDKSTKSIYLSEFKRAEQILDEDFSPYKIDHTSELIIKNIDEKQLGNSRKTNYIFLLEQLNDVEGIEIIFNNLETDIIPMFFPIHVKLSRDKLRFNLIEKEIYCPVHWPIPMQLNEYLNSITKEIYDSILSIPCDQRYQIKDMRRITNAICNFAEE